MTTPLKALPIDIQSDFGASLVRDNQNMSEQGHLYLVEVRRLSEASYNQRVAAIVTDINGFPMRGIRVAFAFDSCEQTWLADENFTWSPPFQHRKAQVLVTSSAGACDQIQGSKIEKGKSGGITVFCLEPEYSSDIVTGVGMLFDHTGIELVFELHRPGEIPMVDRIAALEAANLALETRIAGMEERLASPL